MEVDISDGENGNSSRSMEKGHLEPVPQESSGEGLPYAPENFPNEGENWRWRVGKRVAKTGHYLDRYIYPPEKYRHFEKGLSIRAGIGSKLSLKRFVETAFPKADVDAFFASFIWKVPSKKLESSGSVERPIPFSLPHEGTSKEAVTDSSVVGCKAGNKMCSRLVMEADKPTIATMVCDICCSEPRFCRDCCCILCCKLIDTAYEGYSYIRCEALVSENCICGHVAHLECALQAYMAGTIGGSIGLDAEYYCRRCDAKTELTPHVAKLLQTCKSIDFRDDLVKILNVGIGVLRGSRKASAKSVLARLYRTLTKVKNGIAFEEIWQEDNESDGDGDYSSPVASGREDQQDAQEDPSPSKSTIDCQIQFLQLDNEIDKALKALKTAQESEYKIAEERFRRQRDYLQNLYQQLEHDSSELRKRRLSPNADELMDVVSDRKDQIKQEFKKLKQMKEVTANGFARTSREILKEHFGLEESTD